MRVGRGHYAGSSPPPRSHCGTYLHFYREKVPAISSLVDSHLIVPTHAARRSQQLVPSVFISFLQINSKFRPTWDSNLRTDVIVVAFEGNL